MREFKDSNEPKVRHDSSALPSFEGIHSTSDSVASSQDSSASADNFDQASSIPTVDLTQVRKTAQELKNNPSFTTPSNPFFWNNQPFEQSSQENEEGRNNSSEEDLRSLEIPTWVVKNSDGDSTSRKTSQESQSDTVESLPRAKRAHNKKKGKSKKSKEKKIESTPLVLGDGILDTDSSRSSQVSSDNERNSTKIHSKGSSKSAQEIHDEDSADSSQKSSLLGKILSQRKSSSKKAEGQKDRADIPPVPQQARRHTSKDGENIPFPSDISVAPLSEEPPFVSHVDGTTTASEDRNNIPLPTKHYYSYETIMRLIVAPIIAFIALIVALFAVLTATVWKPNPRLSAQMQASTQYIATDLGVLSLFGKSEKVEVKASSQHNVCLAVASSQNVTGWIGDAKYTRIEGLSNWRTLQVNEARNSGFSAPSTKLPPVFFQNSDLWNQVKCGTDVQLSLKPAENESIIVDVYPKISADKSIDSATQLAPATVQLTWPDINPPNQSIPLGVTAILLFICATLCATVLSTAPVRKRIPSRRQILESIKRLNKLQEEDNPTIHGVSQEAPRWVKDHAVRVKKETTRLRRRSPLSHKSGTSESLWDVLKKGKRGVETPEEKERADSSMPPIPGSGTTGHSFPTIRDVSAVNITRQQEKLNSASSEAPVEHTSEAMAYQEVAAVIEEIKASAEKEDLENGEILDYSPEEVTGFFSRLSLELPPVDGSDDEPPYFSSSAPSPFNPKTPSDHPVLHGAENKTSTDLDTAAPATGTMTGMTTGAINPLDMSNLIDTTSSASSSSQEPPFSSSFSSEVSSLPPISTSSTSSTSPTSSTGLKSTYSGSIPTRTDAEGNIEFSIYDPFDPFSTINDQNSQLSDYLLDNMLYKNLESKESENSTEESSHNKEDHKSRSKRGKKNGRSRHSHHGKGGK